MSETQAASGVRTPWHLWLVGILSLLWNSMGAFDYLMTQTHNEAYMSQFTPEQLEYFYGFPAWVVAAWALAVWCGVMGSLILLMRRRFAVHAFIISFIAMVITTIHNYFLTNGMEIMGGLVPVMFSLAIFVVAALLIYYSRSMQKRGVLK